MADPNDYPAHRKLVTRLEEAGVGFEVSEHEPVYTSAEAAAVRGVELHSGAKALILKAGNRFVMVVLPADMSLNSKATKKNLGCKSIRFASKEEVLSLTGLEPGSIPPLGSLFDLPTYCDARLAENERINFNAGAHTLSVSMSYDDFIVIEHPAFGVFAAEADTH
ncbi:MAG TPA: YbaK/EbsC family protein [Phycisphaerae bacterium]|nr:YbaK/EbsC family protein [Phycisphaerae bacterium]